MNIQGGKNDHCMCEQVRGCVRVPAGQLLPRQLAQLALAVQGAVDR